MDDNQKQKRRRAMEMLAAIVLGAALAEACKYMPATWQLPCTLLSKLISLLGGI